MKEIDLPDFYEKILMPLTPSPEVAKILHLVMQGGETTEDFAQVLSRDAELSHWVRLTLTRLGFEKRVAKLSQGVIILGQNRIRDLILGRQIERAFVKPEESVLAKLKAEMAKAKEKEKSQSKPKKDDDGEIEEENVEAEIIPEISAFKSYLEYSTRAEEVTISIRNSYPGQAFAGGVLFDYLKYFLKKAVPEGKLKDPRLKNLGNYIEEIFRDGIRCGIAANEIMQKISIPHQKNVLVTALIHNIGKALLLAYDPEQFENAFLASTGADDPKKKMSSDESEDQLFGWDHAQLGSLYVGRLSFLAEVERSIDFHHNPHLLKFSNPKLYALSAVMRVSGVLVKLYQRSRQENPNVEGIKDRRLLKNEDFLYLRLNEDDWADIKANFILKLMKTGY